MLSRFLDSFSDNTFSWLQKIRRKDQIRRTQGREKEKRERKGEKERESERETETQKYRDKEKKKV